MDVLKKISGVEFFDGLARDHLQTLASICIPKQIAKREVLFLEGQSGSAIYLLVEGSIQIYKLSSEGREVVIKLAKPGEVFAEVVLFETDTYPVSASALTDCLVLLLPRTQLECLLEDPGFRRSFIAMLMRKQRYLTERLLSFSTAEVEQRFFRFLEEQYGRAPMYEIPISKKDIAAAVGANPETLSRLIQRLTKEGRISWEGGTLAVPEKTWRELDAWE